MSSLLLVCEQTYQPSSWPSYLPLVSSIVVILLFIIDRLLGARLRKKEIERNWYLKVLIEPSIAKISEFYKATHEGQVISFDLLKKAHSSTTHAKYLDAVALEVGKFSSLKRRFEGEVIMPIQARYPATGGELTSVLLVLEDEYSNFLNSNELTLEECDNFATVLNGNRSAFLNALYEPLKV